MASTTKVHYGSISLGTSNGKHRQISICVPPLKYSLVMNRLGSSLRLVSITVHLSVIVSDRGSSLVTLHFQIFWSNILALTVTGVTHLNGSMI